MSEKLRLQEPIRSPLETPRLITPLPYRSGTSFLAWAIVNNNQPVPDVFSKMTKIAASGRLGQHVGRPLLTPDEVRTLRPDLQLLFLAGQRPIVATKLAYYVDREFAGRFDPVQPV
nr:type IV secretory system conjugative DNA transfer family protein [Sphingomonas sp. CDS-1]